MQVSRITFTALAVAASIVANAAPASGQGHPTLHINNRWKECSFQLDAALTQSAFRQFTGEAGNVVYFRPLADARPMGAGKFEVSVLQWKTGIDDHDSAWNDTFVHPDSEHVLFEGSGLAFPGLTARVGVSSNTDVGLYFTKNPNANYGFVGGLVQRSFLNDASRNWSASARFSAVTLFGPDDLNFTVYGTDIVASRSYAVGRRVTVSPYATVSAMLTRSHEKSAVVDLDDESVFSAQATIGAAAQMGVAKVGVEYGVSRVNSFSMRIGFGTK